MYLTHSERAELKKAASQGIDAIDATVDGLHRSNPRAFHTPESLVLRIFVHKPDMDIPLADYVYTTHRQRQGQSQTAANAARPRTGSSMIGG